MRVIAALSLVLMVLAGCMLGPDYKRPEYPVPASYRGQGPGVPSKPVDSSFGDVKWFEVFQDATLQELIRTALAENYDLQIAAQRVVAAREQVIVARSRLFPTVKASANVTGVQTSALGLSEEFPQTTGGGPLGLLSWELDFFGRIRRATEAARADFFASQENRWFIIQSLVTDLARAYLQLRTLDLQLEVAKSTVEIRRKSLDLVKERFKFGLDSFVPVTMVENLYYGALESIPDLERAIEQKENEICILLGRNPGKIPRGKPLRQQNVIVSVPPGLPSSLLERRPDILAAEQQLIAANARIGEAKALLFPRITLTGKAGWESAALSALFTGKTSFWLLDTTADLPIFNAGRLRANVRVTKAQQQQAILAYKKTIQQAFREVSDALIAVRKNREVRQDREKRFLAAEAQTKLAATRYFRGVTSYLEVLIAEQSRFESELAVVQALGNELLAVVALYRALGGGWQTEAQASAVSKNEPS
jgi:NodT family efflux transporter outer membrane factor (OMF) lipoprotein